jgi:hypothetical protein
MADVFVRVWLEMDSSSSDYLDVFTTICIVSGLVTFGSLW